MQPLSDLLAHKLQIRGQDHSVDYTAMLQDNLKFTGTPSEDIEAQKTLCSMWAPC
jgi:hypothetical protein